LPADIQNKLSTTLIKIMALPDVLNYAQKGGNDIVASTPVQFTQSMREEKDIWQKVIREKNIKAE
jgi:tripartite-type tricarboxylate transporter receptor subunit TctC